MKSTGEVMGIAPTLRRRLRQGQMGGGEQLPHEGTAFISVNDHDKPAVVPSGAACEPGLQAHRDPRHGRVSARAGHRGEVVSR